MKMVISSRRRKTWWDHTSCTISSSDYFLRFGFRPSKIYMLAKKAFLDSELERVKISDNDPDSYDEGNYQEVARRPSCAVSSISS